MNPNEIDQFRALLETKQQELLPQLRYRDRIAIEKSADALDETQIAANRELATRNLERESKLLREVQAALARLTAGVYGECLRCEEEISAKRLTAVPWAPLCIGCQQEDDTIRRDGDEAPAWSLQRAA